MENNKREDMVFVSFDRLWDNFKKYWWIAVILMALMMIYGAGTYKNAITSSETTEIELQQKPVVIPDNVDERFHFGSLSVNYEVSLEQFQAETGVVVDAGSTWTMYSQLCQNVILYANTIVNSQNFFDRVNQAYSEAGYSELVTSVRYAGDDQYDKFEVSYQSDKAFVLTYSGIGSLDRITLGTNVAAKVLVEELEKLCGYVDCQINGGAKVMLYVWIVNNYVGFEPTEETVARLREDYAEYNKRITGTVEKFEFSFDALFKVSTLIKGVVGFVVGLFIIFVIAICDKKVRTREELERFFEGEGVFLGEIRHKDSLTEEVTAASIQEMCKKRTVGNLVVTTVGEQKYPEAVKSLADRISCDSVRSVSEKGIEVEPGTSHSMAVSDGVVLLINSGYDEVHTIKNALARIKTVGGHLLGYVIYK